MTRGAASWDGLQQGLGTLDTRPFGGADPPAHSEISGWLAPRYRFDEECDEEAELFLPRTVLAVRNGFWPPRGGRRSTAAGVCGMSATDSLTFVMEMQAENCIHIKWKTILTQSRGAVARENTSIADTSAPGGLVSASRRWVYD